MNLEETRSKINEIENLLVRQVARIAPWLAPVPTAYVVYRSTMEHLDWPPAIAAAAGLVIESLGLSTIAVTAMLRSYNQSKRKSDPKAPTWLAAALVTVYLMVAIALTVALEIVPIWATYAPGIFPFLSLCGMAVIALQSDHEERLVAIAEDKAKRSKQLTKRKEIMAEERATKRAAEKAEKERLHKILIDNTNRCWCGQEITSPRAWGPHGKKHANEVRRILSTDSRATLETVATELETLYGQRPPNEELRRLYNKYRTDF